MTIKEIADATDGIGFTLKRILVNMHAIVDRAESIHRETGGEAWEVIVSRTEDGRWIWDINSKDERTLKDEKSND